MTAARTPLRLLGTALAALLATTVLTDPAQAVPDGPGYQQPDVGECRDLTYDEYLAASDTSEVIDCTEQHSSYVVAVDQLPDSLDWDSSLPALSRAVVGACLPAWEDHLGGRERAREMSAYSIAWFMPTEAQQSHGARWFRCDVVLLGGKRVLPLPSDAAPILDTDLPDSVARCETRTGAATTCARRHEWRSTGAFRFRHRGVPTHRQYQRAAEDHCPRLTSTRRWRWEGPSSDAWRAGHRTVVCYSRRSS